MASDTPMTDTAHELLGKHGKVSVYRMETLERAYNEMTRRTLAYEAAIRSTLKEQAHLADGDNCTLIELKRALREIDGLHAQADVDISGAAGSVKK